MLMTETFMCSGENLGSVNNHKLGNGFFGTTQKAQMMKEKKMDYSISNFCASNDTIKKIK